MTKDLNKKISQIQYNLLNLPSNIKIMDATGTYFINRTYDATGRLLRVKYMVGMAGFGPLANLSEPLSGGNEPQGGGLVGPIQPPVFEDDGRDYCGNIIYENNALSQILFDGGYITLSGTTPTYHYYLQDHLGNNRVVVKQDGTVEQVNHYYPFGALMGESTDGDTQRFKYNGKELERMHGLDWYDYGARNYDAALARWHNMDPLCEKYYNLSPYNYCGNNPINAIDVKGDSIFVLIAPQMALGFGHMAVLIQNDKGDWAYYSKNGTDEWFTLYGEPRGDDKGEATFSTIYDFLNDPKYNPYDIETNERKYTEGFLIPATHEEDVKARKGAMSELNKKYNALGSNCAVTVQSALRAAGKRDGFPSPHPIMFYDQNCPNPNIDYLVSIKIPKIIYENIKKQNQGETIKSYR